MGKQEKTDPIEIRLNAIIRLLSELLTSQDKLTKGSIFQALNQSGLGPKEIGDLFGRGKGDVGAVLTRAKKQKSKSSKDKKNG